MAVTQQEAQEFFQQVAAAESPEQQQALIQDYAANNDNPDEMLAACKDVAKENPDGWIHAAAVLDYYTEAIEGKKRSGEDGWTIELQQGPKHIAELGELVPAAKRIGFKLETDVSVEQLHSRALEQISQYEVDATVANIMEEMHDSSTPRAYFVTKESITELDNLEVMAKSILELLTS